MRHLVGIALALSLAACGSKKTPTPAAEQPAPAVAEQPAPAAPVHPSQRPPEEPMEKVAPSNASFVAVITKADGTSVKGNVRRVERGEDWYAEKGWTDRPVKLTVTLEGGGTEIEADWKDIRTVAIEYGGKSDIDCQFDSSFTPVMYMCVLKSTTTVTTADGTEYKAAGRHKWRFEFTSGKAEEFYIYKLPRREQEEAVPSLGTTEENTDLYVKLQKELLIEVGSSAITRIDITPAP